MNQERPQRCGFCRIIFIALLLVGISFAIRFTRDKPVAHILGAHVENSRTPYVDYPEGTRHQPGEHALELGRAHLLELNEAYHHFFFHYDATPLLVVETSELDANASEEAIEDLVKQIRTAGPGTRYYVPRTK